MIAYELVRPVSAHLEEKAQSLGPRTAFCDAASSLSYGALEERTLRLATLLAARGVAPGDAVAIHVRNSVRWVELCLGIVRRGAVAVPISADATEDEILYRLQDAGCVAAFTSARHAGPMIELAASAPALRDVVAADEGSTSLPAAALCYDALMAGPADAASCQGEDLDAPAFILYTSGTTGRAKGVVLTQRGMLWVVAACWSPIAGLGPGDRMLSPLPLFHSYGLDLAVLGGLATGAMVHIMERFSTEEALKLLRGGSFTIFPAVPTMFHYLLERAPPGPLDFGRLRLCISAGAIMPAALNRAFEERTGVPLIDGFGITETSTMVTLNWPGRPRIFGSCGFPVPGVNVRIVDPASRRDVPYGATGELIVRGPNVMLRYHAKPEETEKALVDGWYLTGDLARADANGFLTITGRLKEIIIRGGQNIAPAEIEEVVQKFPAVLDCAVVGRPDRLLGEVPVLFVEPRDPIDEDALRAFVARHLSAYKVPQEIHVIDRIPRTGSGKIMRFELRKLLTAQ